MKKMVMVVAVALAITAGAAVRTNEWQGSTAANRPATAYDWGDTANWSLGELPQLGDTVKFPNSSSKWYVKLPPGGVTVRNFVNGDNLCLIGDSLTVAGDDAARPGVTRSVTVYADFTNGLASVGTMHPYIAGVTFAGRFASPAKEPTAAWSWVTHALQRYATSSDPLRTDDFQVGENVVVHPGSGNIAIYAPYGSDELTCTWTQTAGSPYLQPTAETGTKQSYAVGTIVTGEGIPEGTFLKRWFVNGDIELSQPVTTTAEANALTFAAFTPEMRSRIHRFSRQSAQYYFTEFAFFKRRTQDIARFEIDEYSVGNLQSNCYGIANYTGLLPGTHVFRQVNAGGACFTVLRNCHFEFAGTAAGSPTVFSAKNSFLFSTADKYTARMTVTNGLSGTIGCFANWTGTVVKDGGGLLKIGLAESAASGALTIEGGAVELAPVASAGAEVLALGSLTMKSGTTLCLPTGELAVGTLSLEEAVTLSGPGKVVVTEAVSDCKLTLTNGAELVIRKGYADGRITETPEGKVAGHPAFWLDANIPSSIVFTEENGTNFVTRWNDWREGEPMFCTNIVYRPQYIYGDTMASRYVRIGRHPSCPSQTYADTEQLVWNVPLKDIRAVFLVQDPTEGGGEILGRSARLADWYYGSQGGPYYRGASSPWSKALVSNSYYTPCVRYGWFYLNGEQVDGTSSGYLGAFMQLVEHEVNTAYRASSSVQRLACDAFGTGYGEKKGTYLDSANGCMRIAEYIIYTNDLTHVERVQTAQYLSRKWLGKDVAYTEFDDRLARTDIPAIGATVEVEADLSLSAATTVGEGALVKRGEGVLRTGSLRSAALTVAAGELIVDSLSLAKEDLPTNAFLHVDASDTATVTYDPASKLVTRWDDPDSGKSLRQLQSVQLPTYRETTAIGKPTVDLGKQGSGSALRLFKKDGSTYTHSNNGGNSFIDDAPYLNSAFFAFGSAGGGGSLLGCWQYGYPSQGYPHYCTDEGAPMFSVPQEHYNMFKNFAAACSNGTNKVRLNGEPCDPCTAPFTGNYDVLAIWGGSGRKTDCIGTFGQGTGLLGGFDLGEVLLYERKLKDDEAERIQAMLAKKWFNRDTTDYLIAGAGLVQVETGARLTVRGGMLEATSVGGGGTLSGTVKVAAGGGVCAVVGEDGEIGKLTVEGALTLPANGALTFAGNLDKMKRGRWTVLEAPSLGDLSLEGWTIPATVGKFVVSFARQGDSLVLMLERTGSLLIVR